MPLRDITIVNPRNVDQTTQFREVCVNTFVRAYVVTKTHAEYTFRYNTKSRVLNAYSIYSIYGKRDRTTRRVDLKGPTYLDIYLSIILLGQSVAYAALDFRWPVACNASLKRIVRLSTKRSSTLDSSPEVVGCFPDVPFLMRPKGCGCLRGGPVPKRTNTNSE